MFVAGCSGSSAVPTTTTVPAPVSVLAPEDPVVTYQVTGSVERADITVGDSSGTTQLGARPVPFTGPEGRPWTFPIAPGTGGVLVLTATKLGQQGTVVCEILLDGVSLARHSASAPFGTASCQATP